MVNLLKHFTIIICDSRVVQLENCSYYDCRVIIYTCKLFIILATDGDDAYLFSKATSLKTGCPASPFLSFPRVIPPPISFPLFLRSKTMHLCRELMKTVRICIGAWKWPPHRSSHIQVHWVFFLLFDYISFYFKTIPKYVVSAYNSSFLIKPSFIPYPTSAF